MVIFGDSSTTPVEDVSILLDDVFYPLLSNPANQSRWPDVIKKDIDSHFQELRNVIAEVRFDSKLDQ
jgi:dynein heavy chain, axonemal